VLIDLDGEILGCHYHRPRRLVALIQEVVVAVQAGSGTVRDIRESVHIHPALPEVVQRAFSGQFSAGGAATTTTVLLVGFTRLRHGVGAGRPTATRGRYLSRDGTVGAHGRVPIYGRDRKRRVQWQKQQSLFSPVWTRMQTTVASSTGWKPPGEFAETDGDEVELIFDGAGTQWVPEPEDEDHDYHDVYAGRRGRSLGV